MSLTLNSSPANISNSGAYNITTSLSESSPTCVNLRIRADITVAGVVIATVEKPKGLPDFDFFDILKSVVPGISFARDSGQYVNISSGSPLVSYSVLFTEVWENAGALTTGATNSPSARKFVPAKGDGTAFTEYVMHDSNCFFANKTLRNNVTKFFTYNPSEYWLVMFTEVVHCELFFSQDGGAYDHSIHFDPANGWAAIIINIGEIMVGVTSNLRIQIGEVGGAKISEVLTINVDSSAIDERVVLEFDGLLGGKEYLAFEGLKNLEFSSLRNYYTTSKKNRKTTALFGVNKQKIETRFKDMPNADYLKSLLISDTVKKLELAYATATDVTLLTENIKTGTTDLFTNQLDMEYEY